MAEKILNTRFQFRYDSYTNWTTVNPVLKRGEAAIATMETNSDGIQNTPNVIIKVGDGATHYNDLKFVSALAADVHTWAKAASKPTYKASEIDGLADYISGEIQDTDLDTRYTFEVTDGKLVVKSTLYTLGAPGESVEVGSYDFVTPEELTAELAKYVTTTSFNEFKAENTTAIAEAKKAGTDAADALNAYKTENDAKVTKNTEDIAAINHETTGILATAKGYTDTEIADFKTETVDPIAAELTQYKTDNNKALSDEIARATAAEAKVLTDAKAYTDEVKAAILGEGITETFDTLVEIQNWINGDGVNATELTEAIAAEAKTRGDEDTAIKARLETLEGAVGETGSVATAIETAKGEAIATAAEDATEKAGQALTDAKAYTDEREAAITTAYQGYADQAETDAKAYTDEREVEIKLYADQAEADALQAAKDYADGLAGDYDAAGSAKAVEDKLTAYQTSNDAAVAKKANDVDLAAIAKTGNVNDLIQTTGDVLVFDCGDASGASLNA